MIKRLFTMEASEDFKNRWAGIQSIILAAGIIIGGAWTWFTFGALRTSNKAQAELESMQLHNAEERQKQSALSLEMTAVTKSVRGDNNRYIEVIVRAKNVGANNVTVCFEDPRDSGLSNCEESPDPCSESYAKQHRPFKAPLQIERARGVDSGQLVFDPPMPAVMSRYDCPTPKPVTGLFLRTGETEMYTAAIRIPKSGLYRVSFFSYAPKGEEGTLGERSFWAARDFLAVD